MYRRVTRGTIAAMTPSPAQTVAVGAIAAAGAVAAYRIPYVRWTRYSHLVGAHRFLVDRARVALTFDDGPDRVHTPRLLDLLDDLDVRATFFVCASDALHEPALTREIVERGHELGSHGYHHASHRRRWPNDIVSDVRRAGEALRSITGEWPRLYRPPMGAAVLPTHLVCAGRHALTLWSADGTDWSHMATPESVCNQVIAQVTGGEIVLLHDSARYYTYPNPQPVGIDAAQGR